MIRDKMLGNLFQQINTGLQVKPKIYKDPVYPLFLVFLLFQDEHVVVEKLLQLFVCEVDAQLLKAV